MDFHPAAVWRHVRVTDWSTGSGAGLRAVFGRRSTSLTSSRNLQCQAHEHSASLPGGNSSIAVNATRWFDRVPFAKPLYGSWDRHIEPEDARTQFSPGLQIDRVILRQIIWLSATGKYRALRFCWRRKLSHS